MDSDDEQYEAEKDFVPIDRERDLLSVSMPLPVITSPCTRARLLFPDDDRLTDSQPDIRSDLASPIDWRTAAGFDVATSSDSILDLSFSDSDDDFQEPYLP